MDQRDDADTLSAGVSVTFTWREWGLIRDAIIAAPPRRFTRDELRLLSGFATRIDVAMTDCEAWHVWMAEQWAKMPVTDVPPVP